MCRLLILYATTEGQTRKIAEFMAWRLRQHGHEAQVVDVDAVDAGFRFVDIDGVIVGGSVHYGRHQASLRRFLSARAHDLRTLPGAFFSVSGAAADPGGRGLDEARTYAARLLRQTGWDPDDMALFAGALRYSRYGPVKRWMISRIAARQGTGTDTRRDYEYTDWEAVGRFAEQFAARL